MGLEYLGYYAEATEKIRGAFISGTLTLEQLRKKTLIIFGAGQNGKHALCYLRDYGLDCFCFCDNNRSLWGSAFLRKPIVKPTDAYKVPNAYFIIAVAERNIFHISSQLISRFGNDFSCFFIFDLAETNIREVMLKSINSIITTNIQRKLPVCINDQFIALEYIPYYMYRHLLKTTTWWGLAFSFLLEELPLCNNLKMLDVGPGLGLFSHIFCNLYPSTNTTWICYSEQNEQKDDFVDIVSKKFPLRKILGVLENPEFHINETFDVICFTEVLEHLQCNPIPTLRKLGDMLTNNGYLLLTTPTPKCDVLYNYDSYKELPDFAQKKDYGKFIHLGSQKWMEDSFSHCYIYSLEELEELFNTCGLEIVKYAVSSSLRHNFLLKRSGA